MDKNSKVNLRSKSRGLANGDYNTNMDISRKESFVSKKHSKTELSNILERKKESIDKKRETPKTNHFLKSYNTSQDR